MATRTITRYRTRRVRVRGRSRAKFQLPLAVVGGFMPLAFQMYRGYTSTDPYYGGIKGAVREGCQQFGVDPWVPGGNLKLSQTVKGIAPILGGILLHKLAGRLGVNRALGRAGIPIIRI